MIAFLQIPRSEAEKMYLLGPGQYHRNWYPESSGFMENRLRRQVADWMSEKLSSQVLVKETSTNPLSS